MSHDGKTTPHPEVSSDIRLNVKPTCTGGSSQRALGMTRGE
jgi:hypothetical protein